VLLSGEPGIGKSRIAESLWASLDGKSLEGQGPQGGSQARLRYSCSPHHAHSPLYPFIAELERAAGIEPGSTAQAKLEKLQALLEPAATERPRDVALIAELLGVPLDERDAAAAMTPHEKREMTLTALLDRLEDIAA